MILRRRGYVIEDLQFGTAKIALGSKADWGKLATRIGRILQRRVVEIEIDFDMVGGKVRIAAKYDKKDFGKGADFGLVKKLRKLTGADSVIPGARGVVLVY